MRKLTSQVYFVWSILFLHKGCDLIKKREKQKREAMSNLYYLKDITLDVFESYKTELKITAKMETGLHLYSFIFSLN